MEYSEFRKALGKGGKTQNGISYDILENGNLRIISPTRKNHQPYDITQKTAKNYFDLLEGGCLQRGGKGSFSYDYSAWFLDVYRHIKNSQYG